MAFAEGEKKLRYRGEKTRRTAYHWKSKIFANQKDQCCFKRRSDPYRSVTNIWLFNCIWHFRISLLVQKNSFDLGEEWCKKSQLFGCWSSNLDPQLALSLARCSSSEPSPLAGTSPSHKEKHNFSIQFWAVFFGYFLLKYWDRGRSQCNLIGFEVVFLP